LHTVVGLWTSKRDQKKSLDRLACEGRLSLVTSVTAAIAQVYQMIQPTLLQRSNAGAKSADELEPVAAVG
jgi:hypothetical protein